MQALGLSWPQLMLMPGDQYRGWLKHFRRHPPEGIQFLLATLCALTATAGGAKNVSHADFAPWLAPKAEENKTIAWVEGLILERRVTDASNSDTSS